MNLRIQQLSSTNRSGNNSFAQTGINRVAGLYFSGAASPAAPVLDQLQGQLQQGLQNAGLAVGASTLLASGGSAAVIGAKASTIGCLGLDGPTSPAMTSFALGSQ